MSEETDRRNALARNANEISTFACLPSTTYPRTRESNMTVAAPLNNQRHWLPDRRASKNALPARARLLARHPKPISVVNAPMAPPIRRRYRGAARPPGRDAAFGYPTERQARHIYLPSLPDSSLEVVPRRVEGHGWTAPAHTAAPVIMMRNRVRRPGRASRWTMPLPGQALDSQDRGLPFCLHCLGRHAYDFALCLHTYSLLIC